MSKKGINPLVIGGLGIGAYLLLRSNTQAAATTTATATTPVTVSPVTQTLASLLPGSTTTTQQIPTTYGINNIALGGNNNIVANYAQLLQANPNLGNPNYQMTAAENAQYLANYNDLRQGLQLWIGKKDLRGVQVTSLSQAAQEHWTIYGCAEKRIFLPLEPPDATNYVPPPPAPKSSSSTGSTIVSTALNVATTVLPFILGETAEPDLNDADQEILFTGAAILYDILPLYANADPKLTGLIHNKLDQVLKENV